MNLLDWCIIGGYCFFLVAMGFFIGRRQFGLVDYYVGGRKLRWWPIGLSTMATQCSAISFISAPAFVALKRGGGMKWIEYEFALPLAVIIVMVFLIPFYRRAEVVSVYEYLERRFNHVARASLASVFLISRSLATGIALYACAIVVSVCFGMPLWLTIITIGVVTIIYDVLGGIRVVIYSDVIQMFILFVGVIICLIYACTIVGGFGWIIENTSLDRLNIVDLSSHGIGDGSDFPFWALLIGGIFLYASYYGCDQSQVQRELSATDVEDTKISLMFNGLARFPLVLLYCFMGLAVGAVILKEPSFASDVVEKGSPDYMIPMFVMNFLPHGIKALIFVAILASAMSSLDSGLNSLSASTMRDFYQRYINPKASESRYLFWSKATTAAWGVGVTGFAFYAGNISETVIEGINKIGSLFYGPILAMFMLAIVTKRTTATGAITGLFTGVVLNMMIWLFLPGVFWMWWNFTGFVFTFSVGFLVSLFYAKPPAHRIDGLVWEYRRPVEGEKKINWRPKYLILILFFLLILVFSYCLPSILMK
jgi:SSS family solute:Na+ symporter